MKTFEKVLEIFREYLSATWKKFSLAEMVISA